MNETRDRRAFPRFLDLDGASCNVDLHVHTNRTDGLHSIHELLTKAEEIRLGTLAFTEHVRRDTPWFGEFAREIRSIAAEHPDVEVLVGCEAKALATSGGVLDASAAVLDECDIVLGSVHRFPDGQGGLLDFADLAMPEMARIERDLAIALAREAPIDVLAHPGGMCLRRHGQFPEPYMREIMEAVVQRDIAIEISTSYLPALSPFLDLCSRLNPRVSIGSDAHRLSHLGTCRDRLREHLNAA